MYDELISALRETHEHAMEWERNPFRYAALYKKAADVIEQLIEERDAYRKAMTHEHNRAANLAWDKEHCWIPVTERLPETGVDVLVKFPQNMAVASIDIGEWVVNSGDGWCTDINLAGGEKTPTHWMPLPQPPKEE